MVTQEQGWEQLAQFIELTPCTADYGHSASMSPKLLRCTKVDSRHPTD